MSDPAPDPKPSRKPRRVTARVQIAPGVSQEVTFPARAAARWGVVRLREKGGVLVPDLKTWTGWYRLTEKPERDLGLPFHAQWYQVMGLGKFITVRRPSPAVTLIDVDSLYQFLQDAEDAEYWTPERIERWQEARRSYNSKLHRVVMEKPAKNLRPVEPPPPAARPVIVTVRRPPPPPHPELFPPDEPEA